MAVHNTSLELLSLSLQSKPVETASAPKRPKTSQETRMLVSMAREVVKKLGKQQVNKHEEIRGKLGKFFFFSIS